ncbi:hypothetical protein [Streptomyces sp. NBC_01506]|uniref:hypothetical protein n=1 Tax=Streptomyces sp. NBC_01506 TaxID=2903887 RepID=UPI00386B758D
MGKRRRRTAVLSAIVVVAVAVGGCGSSGAEDDKSSAGKGTSDVARMSSALKTLKGYDTVHMDGHYMSRGGVGLQVDRKGNCVGTVEYGGQGIVEVIHVGGERLWYRYDDATLTSWRRLAEQIGPDAVALHDKAAKKARGKYIESVADEVTNDRLRGLCDLDEAFAEVPDSVDKVKPRNPETKDGKRVVGLVQQPEGDEVTVYVPVEGDPVPLRVEFEIDDEPVELDIVDAGKPVKATPPPADQTVTWAEVPGLLPEIPEHMQSQQE